MPKYTIIGYEKVVSKLTGSTIRNVSFTADDVGTLCDIIVKVCGQPIKGVHSSRATTEEKDDGSVVVTIHYEKTA